MMKFAFPAVLVLAAAFPALAGDYAPDVAELDGGESYAFPADDAYDLSEGGTIEFWAAADWRSDPGYDPVILSNTGEQGSSYLVAINADRDALIINSGHRFETAPFDFSDGKLHHVALAHTGDETFILIDGKIAGAFEFTIADLPSSGFFVGSANGKDAPFMGAIAGLRLWSLPLDPVTIADFSLRNVEDADEPHPDLPFLAAMSDFRAGGMIINEDNVTEE
jgi:hypothetical protein